MGTQLLLIISKSRVVSDSYRLELHDDHPTRMTGVLQGPLTNYVSVALLIKPVLKIPLTVEFSAKGAISPSHGSLGRLWGSSGSPDHHPPPSSYPTRVRVSLSLPFCPLLCEHNSFAEEADSIASTIAERVNLSPMTRRRV